MFSRRTGWNLTPNRIADAVTSRRAHGLPIFDLTETNPTRVGLPVPEAAWREAAQGPLALAYDPDPQGLRSAREAVASYHGGRVAPDRIVLAASTSEAYAQLFKLLCDPGDRVLVPAPSYPLFEYLAALESVTLDSYPSYYEDGWHIDLETLEAKIDGETRAILVVSPNNPTGAMLRRHELLALSDICRRHELALICDEVFADYAVGSDPQRVATLAGHDGCMTFVLSGLSKVCLTPGLKVGWTLVSGPRNRVAEALARLELIADTYLSVGTPPQLALPRLLEQRAELQRPLVARLAANRTSLVNALEGSAGTVLTSDGGWSAVVRVPVVRSEDEWVVTLLQEAGVLLHPGYFFDFPKEAHLVVSLLVPEAEFASGASLIANQVRDL